MIVAREIFPPDWLYVKENPKGMFTPDPKAVIVIPPEEETRMPAQKAAEGVKGALDSVKNIISGNK